MTADAVQVAERANEALDLVPTFAEALGCMDCSRIFRVGAACPYCASQSLLNVSDCLGDQRIVERLRDAREGKNEGEVVDGNYDQV